ncbi:hypothetical protein [Aquimarina brevivitae]|nr:hypothetical protein [Aquimarina brevivitae]
MKLPRINLEQQLQKTRAKNFNPTDWNSQVQQILEFHKPSEALILDELQTFESTTSNPFIFDKLETDRIYHLDHIKKICIDYRLRFLDTKYFKGKFPNKTHKEIEQLQETHNITLKGFKIVAPSKLFKLENADDPLLFAPMGNDYFYLIDKWGNDLHPLRKFMMWFFKSFENLIVLTFLVSLFLTFMVPEGLFGKTYSFSNFIMIFLFMFKSVAAVVIYYGFATGKNFNTAIWNSKYFNA